MTKKITFCGMCTALSVAIVMMTGFFPYNTVFIICAATALFPLAKIKCGSSYSVMCVIAGAAVAFMMMGDKIHWLGYALLSVYSVLKGLIESLNKMWLEILIKLIICLIGIAVFSFIVLKNVLVYTALAGVAGFFIYDVALSVFINYIVKKLRFFK